MGITFDYFSVSLLLGGFTALLSGIVVFIHNRRNVENIAWLLSNITSAIWSFGYFFTITAQNYNTALLSDWILHMAAILIPVCYLLSVLSITKTYHVNRFKLLGAALVGAVFLVIAPTSLFIRDVVPKAHFAFVPDAGPAYIYFTIYFFALVLYSLYIVFKKYQESSDPIEKQKYKFMILFTLAGFAGGGSVFFLTFNVFILPYPLILFSLYPAISGYAIFRYQLFDVKVITTEILVFMVWIFILIRTLLSISFQDRLINGGLLIILVATGIFLIRSVIKEVALRERVEKLAEDLEKVNLRLKELDQLKSEFLSLATHQIRAPLTAVKGYASLVLEGDYGEISDGVRHAVKTIFESCQNLVVIVNEFLDISRIEQGRMKYDLVDFDAAKLTLEIIEELKPNIEKAHLTISCTPDPAKSYTAHADIGKIKQVIGNVIDNSIKYTPEGGITIDLEAKAKSTVIKISDTGIGVDKEDIPKLFGKFVRAKDANKTNVIGTGLGLYVAKQMIEAQNGKIWVESEGKNKGSQFYIELPRA